MTVNHRLGMDCADKSAEEDPLLSPKTLSSTRLPSSASTGTMSMGEDEDDDKRKMNNRTKLCGDCGVWVSHARFLCLVMVLDLMTSSVQIPSMPKAFESHGMDLRWQGWVASVYGLVSFFVGPVLGRLSDSVGRVAMLRMSCIGSMIGALGSMYATGKWTFIAARTLPGLLKCSPLISQAYMVDVSQGSGERSKNLGMLGASFGVAFVLGPPLGGTAADYDIRLPFIIAFVECVLLYMALQFLPEPARKSGASKKVDGEDGDAGGGGGGVMKETAGTLVVVGNGGDQGGKGGGIALMDKAQVLTATVASSCTSSSLGSPGANMKRTKSSLLMASEKVKAAAAATTVASPGGFVVMGGKGGPWGGAQECSAKGLKRSRSSLQVAAAENGMATSGFAEEIQGQKSGRGGAGKGCGAPPPRISNGGFSPRKTRGRSPGITRSKTLTATPVGGAITAVVATPVPAKAGGPGGGPAAAGEKDRLGRGGEGGEGAGRLGIFRGPGGRQMLAGFHDRFFLVLAESVYHASFAPFLTSVLAFPTGGVGFLLSFMGLVSALTNAFLVGSLTSRVGERRLMASSLVILAVGWAMWSSVSGSLPYLLVALALAGVGGNVFQTVNKAAVAQHAPPELVGTVMGMSAALETFGRSIAGPMSGYLFDALGARGVPLTCSVAATYVAVVLSLRGTMRGRGANGVGGEGGEVGDGPRRRGSKTYIKRK